MAFRSLVFWGLAACAGAPPPPAPAASTAACPPPRRTEPPSAEAFERTAFPYVDGQLKVRAGANDEGIAILRKVLDANPTFAPAYRGLGIAYVIRGTWVSAYTAYWHFLALGVAPQDKREIDAELKRLTAKHPALTYFDKGVDLFDSKQYVAAIEWFKLALNAKPEFALPAFYLGRCFAELGQEADAAAAYRSFLLLDPTVPDAHEAESYLSEYLPTRRPEGIFHAVGVRQHEAGNDAEAIHWYALATEQAPTYTLPLRALAISYAKLGRGRLSIAAYQTYLQREPRAAERDKIKAMIADYLAGRPPGPDWSPTEAPIPERVYRAGADLLVKTVKDDATLHLDREIAQLFAAAGDASAALTWYRTYLTRAPQDRADIEQRIHKLEAARAK